MLVLDSGNALFRTSGPASEADKARASLILSTMGQLGTKVMAVGFRDLMAGPGFLAETAKKAGVTLVSTNLEWEGKPLFQPSVVLEQGGVKVAIVASSGFGAVPEQPAVKGGAVLPALKAELARLPPRDLTVLLAAAGYEEAMALADALSGSVDVVIQSGEFRGTIPPQPVKNTFLLASGQRGQAIGVLRLELGKGGRTFFDSNEAERDKDLLTNLDRQITSLDERIKLAGAGEPRTGLERLRNEMKQRRTEQAKKVKKVAGSRTLKLEWVLLGQLVADDEAIKAEVLKVEPSYSGLH